MKFFHLKEKFWKFKLQTCPDPSKVAFIMYSDHTLQVHHLIKNIVTAIERETGDTTKTSTQSEVAFHNEEDRRALYETYNGNDGSQRISHNHRKLTTIYCATEHRNLLVINLLRAFLPYPYQIYLTVVTQQIFIPALGACLAYQLYRNFPAYGSDSGRISVIADRAKAIDLLVPKSFHSLVSLQPK